MKSKAPLALMEQMVMLLVFALAAALCLQAFVQSDEISRRSEARDRAVVLCQSVAETIRHNGGVEEAMTCGEGGLQELGNVCYLPANGSIQMFYGADWEWVEAPPVTENTAWAFPTKAAYELQIEEIPTQVPGLGQAKVRVNWTNKGDAIEDDLLFELTVSWQKEVTAHG